MKEAVGFACTRASPRAISVKRGLAESAAVCQDASARVCEGEQCGARHRSASGNGTRRGVRCRRRDTQVRAAAKRYAAVATLEWMEQATARRSRRRPATGTWFILTFAGQAAVAV